MLDSCSVAEECPGSPNGEEAYVENTGKWWLGASQSLTLRNSSFRSTTPGRGLLQIIGPQLQLMIRGCALENVVVRIAGGVSAL